MLDFLKFLLEILLNVLFLGCFSVSICAFVYGDFKESFYFLLFAVLSVVILSSVSGTLWFASISKARTPVASAPVASAPVASAPVASAPVAFAPVAPVAPVASALKASAPVACAPAPAPAPAPVASAPALEIDITQHISGA